MRLWFKINQDPFDIKDKTMKTPIWKKIIFLSLPFAMFLIMAEIGLRLANPHVSVRVVCFHPIYEREYCANSAGRLKRENTIHVNRYGMLDREYTKTPTDDVMRIAVLGDSMTAGEEVGEGKRYHELWEQWLPKRLGQNVEVLNFGVRGFGTWEALQMHHLKVKEFRPDYTVLSFYWGNDVENNLEALAEAQPDPLRDQYQIPFTRKINLKRKNFNKWLWNHSAVYQLSRKGYDRVENNIKTFLSNDEQRPVRVEKQYAGEPLPYDFTRQVKPFQPPLVGDNLDSNFDDKFFFDSKGWHLTRQLIRKLNQEVHDSGSRLIIVHFMNVEQYHDYPRLPLREFDRFLAQENIPHLNLYSAFNALSPQALAANTFEDDTHFNATGHRFVADHSIDFLVRQLLGSGRVT